METEKVIKWLTVYPVADGDMSRRKVLAVSTLIRPRDETWLCSCGRLLRREAWLHGASLFRTFSYLSVCISPFSFFFLLSIFMFSSPLPTLWSLPTNNLTHSGTISLALTIGPFCSGDPALRTGSAESWWLFGKWRHHPLQRACLRQGARDCDFLAPGTFFQHLSVCRKR